eukprot:Skav201986  [mRNA]  locus=scaffold269:12933:13849:+ [translate_table: standard]
MAFVSLYLYVSAVSILAWAEREESPSNDVMLMQKRLALQPSAPTQSMECAQEVTEQQQNRPVEDVMAESPGDDGRKIVIRDLENPWDDIYCLANGWYDLPRHELTNNITFLEEVSDKACEEVKKMLGTHYHTLTLDDLKNHIARNEELITQMQSETKIALVSPAAIQSTQEHLAIQCMMRGNAGKAICEIAFCAYRGCLSPDGQMIFYRKLGECTDV